MNFTAIDILSTPRDVQKQVISCVHCGLVEELNQLHPLINLERIEYHRRGSCIKNDIGLKTNNWLRKWQGEE